MFGAIGIVHVIVPHITNVWFLWQKRLCHCCVLQGLFAEKRSSAHWDDWFALGLVAFLHLLGNEMDSYEVGFRNRSWKIIFFFMITAYHAVLLQCSEIALIYWPHFIAAYIAACSQHRLRQPLLPYPETVAICPTTVIFHIGLACLLVSFCLQRRLFPLTKNHKR